MVPFNLSKRFVDPYALAIAAGIGRKRGCTCPGARRCACYQGIPAVWRRGVGLRGLDGQALDTAAALDPEQYSKAALMVMSQIEDFLNLGQGRREADQIVPIQNQIHHQVLAPVAEAVNASYRHEINQSQLAKMLSTLLNVEEAWLMFLHDTEWTDGRAAVQAEATLDFLFADQARKIRELQQTAPSGGNVDIPDIGIVHIPGAPDVGGPGDDGGGYGSYAATGQSYLPIVLAAAAFFVLPKVLSKRG